VQLREGADGAQGSPLMPTHTAILWRLCSSCSRCALDHPPGRALEAFAQEHWRTRCCTALSGTSARSHCTKASEQLPARAACLAATRARDRWQHCVHTWKLQRWALSPVGSALTVGALLCSASDPGLSGYPLSALCTSAASVLHDSAAARIAEARSVLRASVRPGSAAPEMRP
jgi:hypothetical protein